MNHEQESPTLCGTPLSGGSMSMFPNPIKTMTDRNPAPTVDIIIELIDRPHRPIVLIERLNPPYGWALPGGFVDYGESVEAAAVREAKEETGLEVKLVEQFHVYSAPDRDPRQHTLSVVFMATATGTPVAQDDAKSLEIFESWQIPTQLCFDHGKIIYDYWQYRHYRLRPCL
jgi:8-oxo-dGTP diphosphatase